MNSALYLILTIIALLLLFFNLRLRKEIVEHEKTAEALQKTRDELALHAKQTEQFSLSAASVLTIGDDKLLFSRISEAIVKYSDYERVLISLFKESPPYRDLIGYAGVSAEIVDKVKKTDLKKSWYDGVFRQGIRLGQFSYYIPHTMKHILNQEATIYGNGHPPEDVHRWHPEDNLFVKMSGENGEFLGVISVDNSKSGEKPTNEIVRPLEVYASLIAQLIILRRSHQDRQILEQQLRQAQKMEAIGSLTGGIAHDFNNILGVLIGNAELALELTQEDNPVSLYLQEILSASLRARDIVRHLLAFSRKTGQELQPVIIADTIEESLRFLRSIIPSTIEIIKKIDIEGRKVLADTTQIHQILLNLCTNAVHAMEERGTTLEIGARCKTFSAPHRTSDSKTLPVGEYIEIRIRDDGVGIEEKHLHRIFDPYFTTKEIGKGTGMGLSIVLGILKNHNGAIDVSSSPETGTTFLVYLPVSYENPPDSTTTMTTTIPKKGNILLIDDEADLLEILTKILHNNGYTVVCHTHPQEALKDFSSRPDSYDIVITDMTMPGMTGIKLASELFKINKDIPIFLTTGYSGRIDEQSALEQGIRRYMEKPLITSELLAAIQLEIQGQRTN